MKVLIEASVIVALASVAGGLTKLWHPRAPAWYQSSEPLAQNEVTLDQIEEGWGGKVIWIDARQRSEYEKGHHPGALLLNEEEWADLLWSHAEILQSGDKPAIVYCAGQACAASRKVAQRLRESMGMEEVYYLRGGWKALRAVRNEGDS